MKLYGSLFIYYWDFQSSGSRIFNPVWTLYNFQVIYPLVTHAEANEIQVILLGICSSWSWEIWGHFSIVVIRSMLLKAMGFFSYLFLLRKKSLVKNANRLNIRKLMISHGNNNKESENRVAPGLIYHFTGIWRLWFFPFFPSTILKLLHLESGLTWDHFSSIRFRKEISFWASNKNP